MSAQAVAKALWNKELVPRDDESSWSHAQEEKRLSAEIASILAEYGTSANLAKNHHVS